MPMLRARRVVFSWIALAAILLVMFAPSLSGMSSSSPGFAWDQVCSAGGTAFDSTASSRRGSSDTPADAPMFEHCPYCALHADLAPPPDPLVADAGVALVFREQPRAFLEAPNASAVWTSAQPRAPPVAT